MRAYYKAGGGVSKSPAWTRKEGKSESGGLNKKGVASYRKANPGSKLKTAVTTKPSKLKKGSKAAKRRKSFCARMKGMKKRNTSSKTANDPNSRITRAYGSGIAKWRTYRATFRTSSVGCGRNTPTIMRSTTASLFTLWLSLLRQC